MAEELLLSDLTSMGVITEATYGAGVPANGTRQFGIMKGAITFPEDAIDWIPEYMHGHGRNPKLFAEGKHECKGSMEFHVQNARFLNLALGGKLTETSHSGYKKHIIEAASAEDVHASGYRAVPSFAWQVSHTSIGDTNWMKYALGCKVNTMTLRAEDEGILTASLDIIAQKVMDGSTSIVTPALEATNVYQFSGGHVTIFGALLAEVVSFELEINNNLKPKFYWSSASGKFITTLLEQRREIVVKMKVGIKDKTVFTRLIAGRVPGSWDKFDVVLKCIRDSPSPATDDYIQITCKDCWLKSAPTQIPEEDIEIESELEIVVGYIDNIEVRDQITNFWS